MTWISSGMAYRFEGHNRSYHPTKVQPMLVAFKAPLLQ